MKTIKRVGGVIVVVWLISHFFQPAKNTGDYKALAPFYAETNPSKEVKEILTKACLDCHSNTTQYPWYSGIVPVNYWMANHIEEGKEHLNFSNWGAYSLKRKEHKMEEVYEEVEEQHMPISSYTWTHGDAKLSADEVNSLVNWAKEVQATYKKQLTQQ